MKSLQDFRQTCPADVRGIEALRARDLRVEQHCLAKRLVSIGNARPWRRVRVSPLSRVPTVCGQWLRPAIIKDANAQFVGPVEFRRRRFGWRRGRRRCWFAGGPRWGPGDDARG